MPQTGPAAFRVLHRSVFLEQSRDRKSPLMFQQGCHSAFGGSHRPGPGTDRPAHRGIL